MSKTTITIEEIQGKTIRETVAISQGNDGIKKLVYVFPIASGLPYWRVVVNGEITEDHLELAAAVEAYNRG
jgi:hypothetical protein